MKQNQINKITMYETVVSFFLAATATWESKKPIAAVFEMLRGFLSEITGLSLEQASATTQGATEVLKSALQNMAALAFGVVQKLRPYARMNGIAELLAAIDYSKTDLTQTSQKDAINMCKIILEQAKKYLSQMAGFELTPQLVEALEAAINGVALLAGERDAIIGTHKTATEGIPVLIDKADAQLEILDDLVPALIDDAKFVETYNNNRRIIDRA